MYNVGTAATTGQEGMCVCAVWLEEEDPSRETGAAAGEEEQHWSVGHESQGGEGVSSFRASEGQARWG